MPMLNDQYPDLSRMFGQASAMPAFMGMQQAAQARKMQEQNLATVLQQNQIAKERAPVDLQHIMSQTEQNRAQVPLFGEQTRGLKDTNDMNDATREQRKQAVISKLATQMTEDQLKQEENNIQQMLVNPDTPSAIRQRLLSLRELFPKIYEEQQKQKLVNQGHVDVANIAGETSRDVARIGANSRENVASTRAASASRNPKTYQAMAVALYQEAVDEKDPARKQQLLEEARSFELAAQKLAQSGALATPKIDTGAVAGMPTTGGAPPGPTIGTNAGAPTKENAATQKAVTDAGWAWEPDKYDYRIDPASGKAQRKPKTK